METFELSVEMIIGLRSFFCCLFGTSSRTNPRISSKSCLKYTIGITNYTCDTQFQINHQFYTCTVLFLFGFFLIHTLNSIPPLWPNPSPWAHDLKKNLNLQYLRLPTQVQAFLFKHCVRGRNIFFYLFLCNSWPSSIVALPFPWRSWFWSNLNMDASTKLWAFSTLLVLRTIFSNCIPL